MDNLPVYQRDLLLHEPLHNCTVATCVCIHKPPYTHRSTSTAQNLCTIFFIRRLSHLKKGDKKLGRSCIAAVATNVMTPLHCFQTDLPLISFPVPYSNHKHEVLQQPLYSQCGQWTNKLRGHSMGTPSACVSLHTVRETFWNHFCGQKHHCNCLTSNSCNLTNGLSG